jgi:hypothetical protein
MVRDTKRGKIYRWEREQWWWRTASATTRITRGGAASTVCYFGNDSPMPLDQCAALIEKLWKNYSHPLNKRTPPKLADGRGCRRAWGERSRITLPVWARTAPVVCHEVAHAIEMGSRAGRPIEAGHGPTWIGIYCELLELAGITRALPTKMSAIDSGLDVNMNPTDTLWSV